MPLSALAPAVGCEGVAGSAVGEWAFCLCKLDASTLSLTLLLSPSLSRRQFETFSYLPPLTADQIARQVDYIVDNGWTPCLEFAEEKQAYVSSESTMRMAGVSAVSATWVVCWLGNRGRACRRTGCLWMDRVIS